MFNNPFYDMIPMNGNHVAMFEPNKKQQNYENDGEKKGRKQAKHTYDVSLCM